MESASTPLPGGTLVIDAHTHIFPPDVCHGRQSYLPRDTWFEHLYANPGALLVTVEDIVASMDAAGIQRSVVCGFPWRDPGLCRAHNDYLADAARRFPDRISWVATVSPLERGALPEAERCFALGAVGLGELNADAQGFDFREPEPFGPLVDLCRAAGRPILFHVSEPVGHLYPGKGTATPDRFLHFLGAFPDLPVVAAHWGGGLPFYELMPEVASLARNVVYDSAASTYLYRFGVFRAVLDIVGPERVMMASDFPVLRQDRFLRRVLRAGLREDERQAVLGRTAERVFGLEARSEARD
ncbi:MAG: amidohydrolase [Thermomicrobiaceae bacterium]|nr:amidohydrolase [Thermomicrobiaceae bacterium]